MKISCDRKIEKKIANEQSIKKNYGKLAGKIIIRLSLLLAVERLSDIPNVPPTRRHKLSGKYADCWGIDIDKSWRMIIKSTSDDLVAPEEITSILIIDIVDYH